MTPEEMHEFYRNEHVLGSDIYSEHYDPLLGYARRLASSWGIPMSVLDPEDVVQDAFVQLLLQEGWTETINKPGAWLCVVVRNQIAKAAQRRRPFADGDPDAYLEARTVRWSSLARQASIEDIYAARAIVGAIADLSGKQQIATYLSRVQGWPSNDIAAFLDCSVSTAGVHVFRGTQVVIHNVWDRAHVLDALNAPDVSEIRSYFGGISVLVGLALALVLFLIGVPWWLAVLVSIGFLLAPVAAIWVWETAADWSYDRRIRRQHERDEGR